jgi:thermitase
LQGETHAWRTVFVYLPCLIESRSLADNPVEFMTHPLRMHGCLPIAAATAAAFLLLSLPSAAVAEDVVPGQVIVRYEPGSSTAERADARHDAGAATINGLGMARAQLLEITDGDSIAATVRQLEAQPGVAYAEPNGISQPALLPDDPLFYPEQWGLYNDGQTLTGVSGIPVTGIPGADINAPAGWNFTIGDLNTVVAVMDTGADLQHLDLVDELWTNSDDGSHGYDFVDDDIDPADLSGHGTHVSGIVAAEGNNNFGTTGVSQSASLMELRICDPIFVGGSQPHWSATCADDDLIQAINYAAAEGARVVNGSISGVCDPIQGCPQAVADALKSHPSTLYVFAAGNDGEDNDTTNTYPCDADQGAGYGADNVICVAATDQSDRRADFSNYGANSVDLGAPGVNIYSTSAKKTFVSDDFETADFDSQWQQGSSNTQDWGRTNEAPLGSFGISDSPGTVYGPNANSEVLSNPVPLPPGDYSSCELEYDRGIDLAPGGSPPVDTFEIAAVLDTDSDGSPNVITDRTFTAANNTAGMVIRSFPLTSQFDQGGDLQVRLRLTTNSTTEAGGVYMDNIRLFCHGTPSDSGFEFLNGTSMATPMVTGAAALLFSDDPTATASQVKNALLDSVDPLPDLTGTTVSGGRLNVYGAFVSAGSNPAGDGGGGDSGSGSTPSTESTTGSSSKKPNTFFNRKPGRVVRTSRPRARVVFKFGSNQAGSGFRCSLDRAEYSPCLKRFVRRLLPGRHVLKVKAVTSNGIEDPTAAPSKFRVKQIG